MDPVEERKGELLSDQVSVGNSATSRATSDSGGLELVTPTTSMTSILANEEKTDTSKESTEVTALSKLCDDEKGSAGKVSDGDPSTQLPAPIPANLVTQDGDVDELSEPEEETAVSYYKHRFSPENKKLDERVKKAPKQVAQIVQYTRLMEDRVQALEREVRELKNIKEEDDKKENEESDEAKAAERKVLPPRLIPETHRTTWSEYAAAPQTHAIDVLYGEPDDTTGLHQSISEIWKSRKLPGQSATAKTPAAVGVDKRPARVRLQSRLLRIELRTLTEFSIWKGDREILAPFKPFVLCETKIREHMRTLMERLEKLEAEAGKQESSADEEGQKSTSSELEKAPHIVLANDNSNIQVEGEVKANGSSSDANGTISQTQDKINSPTPGPEKPISMIPVVDGNDTRVLPGEEKLNPQDIACLMVACNLTRKEAASKLGENDSHDSIRDSLLENAKEEEKQVWEKRLKLFEARIIVQEWKAVVNLLDNELAAIIKLREALRNGKVKEVSFDDLSYMFEPGRYVVTSEDRSRMLRVFSVTGGRRLLNDSPKPDLEIRREDSATEKADKAVAAFGSLFHVAEKFSPLVVDCFQFDFNGTYFGPVQTTFYIKKFDDVQKIESLPVYPINVLSDEAALKEKLAIRGKKFLELCSLDHVVHREYDGLSLDDPPEQIDSQVIVDFDMASRIVEAQQPKGNGWMPKLGLDGPTKADGREVNEDYDGCGIYDCVLCKTAILNDQVEDQKRSKDFVLSTWLLNGQPIKAENLSGDDLMLLQKRIFGFVLRSRKWARLHIDKISPITRDENNFERLVLPKGYRQLVRALVETHFKKPDSDATKDARYNVDLVRGKGKGLIILLHGAPGVGKTSTAECVAEHTQRPLFAITCGDIGETAEEVERNLDRCFQLAHRWGCVLLLDEADVFLAQRSKTDLRRNALVSVFLRVLEYYAGILFLTTNRVGTFDEAFKSRIHMSLWYPTLDEKSTRKIWRMNLERTKEKEKELNLKIDAEKIIDFADDHWKESAEEGSGFWNGRQIRNAFQTAIALAQWQLKESKGEMKEAILTDEHFIKVSKASRSFDKYLEETYGGATEADRAFELDERADHWNENAAEESRRAREAKKRKAKKEKEREKKVAGMNVAPFGVSKKAKKDKKSKKEESASESESEDPKARKQKKVVESESDSDD